MNTTRLVPGANIEILTPFGWEPATVVKYNPKGIWDGQDTVLEVRYVSGRTVGLFGVLPTIRLLDDEDEPAKAA